MIPKISYVEADLHVFTLGYGEVVGYSLLSLNVKMFPARLHCGYGRIADRADDRIS